MCSSAHEIIKDKAFERLIKLEKRKTSYQIGIINNRHVCSIKLSIEAITKTHCNEWTVTSTSNLTTTIPSRNNKQLSSKNAMFVYMSKHVHVPTLFSM